MTPALSQHVRVLKDAGLVPHCRDGTRRLYRIDPDGLAEVRDYFHDFWSDVLDAFKDAVGRGEEER